MWTVCIELGEAGIIEMRVEEGQLQNLLEVRPDGVRLSPKYYVHLVDREGHYLETCNPTIRLRPPGA